MIQESSQSSVGQVNPFAVLAGANKDRENGTSPLSLFVHACMCVGVVAIGVEALNILVRDMLIAGVVAGKSRLEIGK